MLPISRRGGTRSARALVLIGLGALTCRAASGSGAQPLPARVIDAAPPVETVLGRVPLSFEVNRGQAPDGVRFLSRERATESF